MKPQKRLLFVILLLVTGSLFSQQMTFNKVAFPLGSSPGGIGGIVQDKTGYLWIATAGGLYRYDGYRFRRYANNPSDKNTLSATHLETLYIDRAGMIWIATWINGLDRLDPQSGRFIHFKHDPNDTASLSHDEVRAIFEDHEGVLWVGTLGGLDRYDPQTGKFRHFRHDANDPSSLSCDKVRTLYEDKQGILWVGTGSVWPGEGGETDEGGLNRFDRATGKFTRYLHDLKNPHSLINNKVRAIFEDSKGNFWVGTAGDGLHTMDRKTGLFERHQYDPAHPEKLSRSPVNKQAGFDHIGFITEDALGGIWIGSVANGISKYDPKSQRTTHYSNKDSSTGFTGNSGWSFCNSKDGVLLIGTFEGGLFRVDPFHKNITHVSIPGGVTAFNEDPVAGLCLGTGQGVIFQQNNVADTKKFFYEATNQKSLGNNYINSFYRDNEGILWIGAGLTLNRFNSQAKNFTRYVNDPNDTLTLSTAAVWAITDAGNDSLWIGTGDGLDLMNKRTGTFSHFKNNPRDTNSMCGNYVIALLKDRSGNLFVGTAGGTGLSYLSRSTRLFKRFLKGLEILSLLLDSNGAIWVGTESGLYFTKDINEGFQKFNYQGSGLTNILSIQQDDQNKIWLTTPSGIFRIDPANNQTDIYGTNYGINGDNLNVGAGLKGQDGKIYFGDINGYYVFSPDELTSNTAPPNIVLTSFSIGGTAVSAGEKNTFVSALENTKEISLKYNQNVFSFDFAAIHYSSPENNRHLYMLENYDQTWHEAGVEKTASYFNVPPGKYVFRLKAASSYGVWAEKSIVIIISPPWWRTWWAYCVYGLLFVVVAFLVHRYQKSQVIKAEREKTRAREMAQAKEIEKAYHELKTTQSQLVQQEKMASLGELTAGVAHEIQNPLNFVNNFSEVNSELITEMKNEIDKGNFSEARSIAKNIDDNEQKIMFHGKRADAIVKSMLQHSRTSSGQKEPTDINALADEYLRLAYHGLRAKDKTFNAKFETHLDPAVGKINIVPQEIGRVMLNLINNAFYAVDEKKKQPGNGYEPAVTVSTKKNNDNIDIKVSDNGNGISKKISDKIFQPFFTTKPAGQGTGLGLSLAYDVIKAHGGEIKVETKEGEGSEFTIELPC